MRAHTLGRWVGHLVAVAAVGAGATLGISTATVAETAGSYGTEIADMATSESTQDDAADGFEWN